MFSCRKCGANLPEVARFCPRCGAPAAEVVPLPSRTPLPVDRPGAADKGSSYAPRPLKAPANGFEDTPELEDSPDVDAALAKRYLKQPVAEGTVVCRFCRGPLDLTGTYCEQCGAPVEEAAPPGLIKPQPQPPAVAPATPPPPQVPQAPPVQPPKPPAVSPKPATPIPAPQRTPMAPTVVAPTPPAPASSASEATVLPKGSFVQPVSPPGPITPPSFVAAPPAPASSASEATVLLKGSPAGPPGPGHLATPLEETTPPGLKPQSPTAPTMTVTPPVQPLKPPAVSPKPATPIPVPQRTPMAPTVVAPAPPPSASGASEATVLLKGSPVQPVPPRAATRPPSVPAAPPTPSRGASQATVVLRGSPLQAAAPGQFNTSLAAPTATAPQLPATRPSRSVELPPAIPCPPHAPTVAPAGAVRTVPQVPPGRALFAEETAALLALARAFGRRPSRIALVASAAIVVVVAGGVAAWYVSRPLVQPRTQATAQPAPAASAPPHTEAVPVAEAPPAVEAPPSEAVAPAVGRPKRARVAKSAAMLAPAAPAPSPRAQEIASLQNQARDAYAKGNYAEPPIANSIALSKQVLALDPANSYAKMLLEDSANGGKYQVQQALFRQDFAAAHRTAEALAQLLPGRRDIVELKEDIASAERADAEAHRPKPAAPLVAFRAYHMHSEKAPADNGPYCRGMISVTAGHLKFVGHSASEGQQIDTLDIACSEVREIKKNARVASHQNGFHVRTASTNINFVPEDSIAAYVSVLASACGK